MFDPSIRRGLWAFALGLLPSLAAIWLVPDFVTQDGPAHLYNAEILAHSGEVDSPFAAVYQVRLDPLPNWAGHLLLWGLLKTTTPWVAERLVLSLTLVALAGAILRLRYVVAGSEGLATVAITAVILGLNVTWMLGFTSFLLGAALFPVTLGYWWQRRSDFGPMQALGLGFLMVMGYICHLVSLGLTVGGIGVLALLSEREGRRRRLIWTGVGLSPVLPLLVIYKRLSTQGGALRPEWQFLSKPFAVISWVGQLGWVDPISLASKLAIPFGESTSKFHALTTPVLWFVLGLAGLVLLTIRRATNFPEMRGWVALSILLIVAGVVGPDSLGTSHGHYLPQRILLLGLVALVPCLTIPEDLKLAKASRFALGFALFVQSLFVWDYAFQSAKTAGAIHRMNASVGNRRRVATILVDIRTHLRANPLLHADNLLGVGTGNIVWNNYETNHYYFPVQFRPEVQRPPALELEDITKLDNNPKERAARWEKLLARHHEEIDVLVMWGSDPELDRINSHWFEPRQQEGEVHVLEHRSEGMRKHSATKPQATP